MHWTVKNISTFSLCAADEIPLLGHEPGVTNKLSNAFQINKLLKILHTLTITSFFPSIFTVFFPIRFMFYSTSQYMLTYLAFNSSTTFDEIKARIFHLNLKIKNLFWIIVLLIRILSLSLPISPAHWVSVHICLNIKLHFQAVFLLLPFSFKNVFTYLFIHLVLFGQSKRQRLKKCLFRLRIRLRLHTVFCIKWNASNKNVQCTEMQD